MSGIYKLSCRVWPYSTDLGREESDKRIGGELQSFEYFAQDFKDACVKAEILCQGVRSNPLVWQTIITSLEVLSK